MTNLPYDRPRCYGEGCKAKARCVRHTQIERDKTDTNLIQTSYINHCRDEYGIEQMYIPEKP